MESQSSAPLKVCRHCSVASRTEAEKCPSCGRTYGRRRPLRWRWWFTAPIVVVAFLAGFLGWKALRGDNTEGEPEGITFQQGRAVPLGVSRRSLIERVSGRQPAFVEQRGRTGQEGTCLYYLVTDQRATTWQFCFRQGRLAVSSALAG